MWWTPAETSAYVCDALGVFATASKRRAAALLPRPLIQLRTSVVSFVVYNIVDDAGQLVVGWAVCPIDQRRLWCQLRVWFRGEYKINTHCRVLSSGMRCIHHR